MTDDPMSQPDYEPDDDDDDDIYEADVVKIAFCPDCGGAVIVLGEEERDVAMAHLSDAVLNKIIEDLQSIVYRMRN